jgi:hypothetical protein
VQHDNELENEKYNSLHWASRIEAIEVLWRKNLHLTHRTVALAVKALRHCIIFSRRLPIWGRLFLIVFGNIMNNASTISTCFEKWEATTDIELPWKKKCDVMKWTMLNMTTPVHDSRKFAVVEAMKKNWWRRYRTYEKTASFYAQAIKLPYPKQSADDPADMTLYGALRRTAQTEADLHSMTLETQEKVFNVAKVAITHLKHHPVALHDLVMLSFPKNGSTGWATCGLIPKGLPVLQSADDKKVKSLLDPMVGTVTHMIAQKDATYAAAVDELGGKDALLDAEKIVKARKVEAKKSAEAKAKAKATAAAKMVAAKQKAKAKSKSKSKSVTSVTDECDVEQLVTRTRLEHIEDSELYLARIDPRQHLKARSFKLAALYASQVGSVSIVKGGEKKTISGLSLLRKLFKSDTYKCASLLKARDSDPDFADGAVMVDTSGSDCENEQGDDVDGEAATSKLAEDAKQALTVNGFKTAESLVKFLVTNSVKTAPVMCYTSIGQILQASLVSLLQGALAKGGQFQDMNYAAHLLMDSCKEQVAHVIPYDWNETARQLSRMAAVPELAQALTERFGDDAAGGLPTEDVVNKVRLAIICHVTSTLGNQTFFYTDGSKAVTPKTYLPMVGQTVMTELSKE